MPILLTAYGATCNVYEVVTYPVSSGNAEALIQALESKCLVDLDYRFEFRKIEGSSIMAVDMRTWKVGAEPKTICESRT
jgi:hypothetical protein